MHVDLITVRGLFSFPLLVVPRALCDCPRACALPELKEASAEERGFVQIFKTTGVYSVFQRKSDNSRRIFKWAIPETSGHTRLIRQFHMQHVDVFNFSCEKFSPQCFNFFILQRDNKRKSGNRIRSCY